MNQYTLPIPTVSFAKLMCIVYEMKYPGASNMGKSCVFLDNYIEYPSSCKINTSITITFDPQFAGLSPSDFLSGTICVVPAHF